MRFGIAMLVGVLLTAFVSAGLGRAEADESLRPFPLPLSKSSTIPFDVDDAEVRRMDAEGKIASAQREFDIFAWQTFLALNWPADANGTPDRKKTLTDSDRVWGFWRSSHTIFLPDGEAPPPWGAAGTDGRVADLFRSKAAWRQHVTNADENFQAFSGPLVDQNGKWVRYEVLVDHEEFDYLVSNRLYNLDGQVAFSQRMDGNRVDFPPDDPSAQKHGAIEIKLAWKELGPHDDRSRFLVKHVRGSLSEPAAGPGAPPPTRDYDAGLVGMHIALRTRSSPEWVWATFEQIDNVRMNHTEDGRPVHPNFFNPDSHEPPNVLPDKNAIIDPATGSPIPAPPGVTATTWIESLTNHPVQVERVNVPAQPGLNDLDAQLTGGTAALNHEVQDALRQEKSVFQYYELIGTQWPIRPTAPAMAGGNNSAPDSIRQKTPGQMVPVFLVNVTMETYFQKGLQHAGPLEQDDRLADGSPPIDATMVTGTESCVGCHYSAGAAIGFKRNADGSDVIDPASGKRIPIFGENGNFGQTGNAAFSWLLQIEGESAPVETSGRTAAAPSPAVQPLRSPAKLLDISRIRRGQESRMAPKN